MPAIKIRIVLNKPSSKIGLGKFSSIQCDINSLLNNLGGDVGLKEDEVWQASDISQTDPKAAVTFNVVSNKNYSKEFINKFLSAIPKLDLIGDEGVDVKFSKKTIESYSRLASHLGEGDKVKIGLFKFRSGRASNWTIVNKTKGDVVGKKLVETISFYGDIQGTIRTLVKEGRINKCKIREVVFDELIDCEFENSIYGEVVKLLQEIDTIVSAYGLCVASVYDERIKSMKIEKIHASGECSNDAIKRLKGSAPSLTGELSTIEYIRQLEDES